jgi:hypothetical protein
MRYAAAGYCDGSRFDPKHRIENTRQERAALKGGFSL